MRRREFVRAAGSAAALGAALPACAFPPDPEAPFTLWTWVHGDRDRDTAAWRERFARLREAGFHAVLVGGGDVDLVSGAARAEGLEYHRWFWTMNRNGDAWVQENHPEWFTVSRNLESSLDHPPYVGYYKWVCPSRGPVRQYLRGRIADLAAHPAVDGVHLDYVRHCDVILPRALWETYDLVQDVEHPEFDFCYCDVCREQFAALDGRDPLEIPDPPADEAWRRFRWDSVTGVVRELAGAAHEHGKPITAAVFPTPSIARTLVRQDWDRWPLDRFFPMLYQSFYLEDIPWIGEGVREGIAALEAAAPTAGERDARPLNAGLYLPALDPPALAEAVATAREAGAAGVSTFEMDGLTDDHLAALVDATA
ncbi:family 10 glycosylhydrolase [Candidatus Palauibacter sp.]|uniref:family 10 glycosylhydrolase n=1 Tax=Candidatus Palauibacter sp. TaxID=3101350 RepID=UPI003D11031A